MGERFVTLILYCFVILPNTYAFNVRKAALGNNGSIIHSIYQDNKGLIWLGTNNGLNIYDGKSIVPINGYKGINKIYGSLQDEIFAETIYGLKILNNHSDSVAVFEMFNNISFSAIDSKGTFFAVQGNGSIYYKVFSEENFDNIIVPDLISTIIKAFFIDKDDILYILTDEGIIRSFEIGYNNTVYLEERPLVRLTSGILFCFIYNNHIYAINNDYLLIDIDLLTYNSSIIDNLHALLAEKGEISSGLIFKNEFYFGTESGLFVIRNHKAIKVPAKAGITNLLKDRFQDLIWIGTSGGGLFTYSYDPYEIESTFISELSQSVSKPITAMCLDNNNILWLGTEGDGIIILPYPDFRSEFTLLKTLTDKNGLPDNSIFSLEKSEYGIWIGCKSGLAFYSYKYKDVIKLKDISAKDVQAIYEQDSLVWLACYGKGIVKSTLTYKNDRPVLKASTLYTLRDEDESLNRFSSIYVDDRNLLFVNTGNGIFSIKNGELKKIDFLDEKLNATTHVISLNESKYIATTDFGLLEFIPDKEDARNVRLINELASKHIVPGIRGDYWLSTDNGLVLYNAGLNTFRHFDNLSGLAIPEFSNGVSFRDEKSGTLFLGGINGFATIRYNNYDEAMDYMPELFLEKLLLFGIERNIQEFKDRNSNKLIFKSHENFFSLTFNALDYINGNNYT
ncbi:MAG: hypothetical protein LUH10_16260, partial [Tannerellaceae bacterium]|nr:hypothetical protein [Tannerellaceae bacterium]